MSLVYDWPLTILWVYLNDQTYIKSAGRGLGPGLREGGAIAMPQTSDAAVPAGAAGRRASTHFDVIEGRDPGEIKAPLDTAHAAMAEAFGVPERDRYQIVNRDPAGEIVALDTGPGVNRSGQLVIVNVVSIRRTRVQKERLSWTATHSRHASPISSRSVSLLSGSGWIWITPARSLTGH
jgi:hypothetical protein